MNALRNGFVQVSLLTLAHTFNYTKMDMSFTNCDKNPLPTRKGTNASASCYSDGISEPNKVTCPVCGISIAVPDISNHANRCLDKAQSLPTIDDDIPSPPLSPLESPLHDPDCGALVTNPSVHSEDALAACARNQVDKNPPGRNVSIESWLSSQGLQKYTSNILRAGFRSIADLYVQPLTDPFLRDTCGIAAIGARRKLISAFTALPSSWKASAPASEERRAHSDNDSQINPSTNPKHQSKRKLWAIFEPGYRAASDSPSKRPRATTNSRKARGISMLQKKILGRRHRFSQRVPGTSFTVDSFHAAISDPGCLTFFLTHFHADHYGGLRRRTLPDGARVLCSDITAALVKHILRVPAEFIRVLPLNKKIDIPDGSMPGAGASVWLFDANHCPGAVVLLFYIWKTKRYVLHTGDCRFDPRIFDKHEKLKAVILEEKLDFMYLDTTYCNPRYAFPPQDDVLRHVVDAAKNEDKRTRGRCLFFFGTYSIGKEKVFAAVAKALDLKIFSAPRKRGILDLLCLEPAVAQKFVTDPHQARVHVVSMFELKAEGLRRYAARHGLNNKFIGRGLAVIFRPTGWSFTSSDASIPAETDTRPKAVNRSSDQAMMYNVPYSEHSSFTELRSFVQWANPAKIIPTVNARSAEDAERMRSILGHTDRRLRDVD